MVLVDNKWDTKDYNFCGEHQQHYKQYCSGCALAMPGISDTFQKVKESKDDLQFGKLAAKIFTPKPYKHYFRSSGYSTDCYRCNVTQGTDEAMLSCTSPDAFDVKDWNKAMKMRDEANPILFYMGLLWLIPDNEWDNRESWIIRNTTSFIYFRAACFVKLVELEAGPPR